MDLECLINSVEAHPCLYDKTNRDFWNSIKKEKDWDNVSALTGMSKDDCKKIWISLLEKLNEDFENNGHPSGSESINNEKWPYFKSMLYFVQTTNTKRNFEELPLSFKQADEWMEDSLVEFLPPPSKRSKIVLEENCLKLINLIDNIQKRWPVREKSEQETSLNKSFCDSIKIMLDKLSESDAAEARLKILSFMLNFVKQQDSVQN